MFLNALMLAGIGGAAVPFVLHMLSRARYRDVNWGAMMFLEPAGRRDTHAERLRRWGLLVLRMLCVALLAVALARPVIASRPDPNAAKDITAAVIIDCSASMSYDEGGHTRMDLARGAAMQILSGLGRGDRAGVILAGGSSRIAAPQPTADLQSLSGIIADLEPSNARANMAEALTAAVNMLDSSASRGERQLYVICDSQSASWSGITETFVGGWRERLGRGSALNKFKVVPVGSDSAANVAIRSVELSDPPPVRDTRGEIEVRVRNYSDLPRVGVPLTVSAAGRDLLSTSLNLAPQGTAVTRLSIDFSSAGAQVLTAQISGPGLRMDNRMDYAFEVIEPIRTVVIDGATHGDRSGWNAVRAVRGKDGAKITSVRSIAADQLQTADLHDYQVVVLNSVSERNDDVVRRLRHFVLSGGGLLIAADPARAAQPLDTALERHEEGIVPARLGEASDPGIYPLRENDAPHPLVRALHAQAEALRSVGVRRYVQCVPMASAVTLWRLGNGDPLLIERSIGRGRILLLTMPLDGSCSSLPPESYLAPLTQAMIRYLAAPSTDEFNLQSGQEIVATFREPLAGKPTLLSPDGTTENLDVAAAEGRSEVRSFNTQQPGTYILRARLDSGQERTIAFIVRASGEESDLTPLSADRWKSLEHSLGFTRIGRDQPAPPEEQSARELWLELLACVVLLMVVELGLTRRWAAER